MPFRGVPGGSIAGCTCPLPPGSAMAGWVVVCAEFGRNWWRWYCRSCLGSCPDPLRLILGQLMWLWASKAGDGRSLVLNCRPGRRPTNFLGARLSFVVCSFFPLLAAGPRKFSKFCSWLKFAFLPRSPPDSVSQ